MPQLNTLQKQLDAVYNKRWRHQASYKTQKGNIKQACEFFGPHKRIDAITSQDLDDYQQALLSKGLRPATVNKATKLVNFMLKDAKRVGKVTDVPIPPPQLRENNTKDRVITPAEEDAFCLYFEKVGHHEASALLVFMINTLGRWSDIRTLHVCDLHLDRKPRAEVTFRNRKNTSTDTIILANQARQAVAPLVNGKAARDLVFDYSYTEFRCLFLEAKEWMGLGDDKALTIHCTRHTGASRLAAKNCSLPLIMAMGGWKSLSSVKRYLTFQTSHLQQVAAMLEG